MIRFKKLTPDAIIPKRQTDGAAGFDLYASHDDSISPDGCEAVCTGIAAAIPPGWVGLVQPRSGLAFKNGIDTMAGVIDSDYRGEIKVLLTCHDMASKPFRIKKGDRIAQLVVVPAMIEAIEVQGLENTERGQSGFGSTGISDEPESDHSIDDMVEIDVSEHIGISEDRYGRYTKYNPPKSGERYVHLLDVSFDDGLSYKVILGSWSGTHVENIAMNNGLMFKSRDGLNQFLFDFGNDHDNR